MTPSSTSTRAIALTIGAFFVIASCGAGSDEAAPSPLEVDEVELVTSPDDAPAPATTDDNADVPVDTDAEPAIADPASGDSDYLFDQEKLHTFDLELSEQAIAILEGDPTAEEYVEASLSFEGQTFGSVGVRHKGSIGSYIGCVDGPDPLSPSGAKTCTKISMKVKINWEDSKTEFFGQRKLQFHSQNRDDSMMHERLGYWLFSEMGIPASRSTHARVNLNGEYLGIFALTELVDGRFTRANFDDGTGNLYKEIWPFWSDFSVSPEAELRAGLRTNEDDPETTTDIIRSFAEEFLAAEPADRADVLVRRADVEALMTYVVVDRAIRHDDGPMHWYCNEQGCGNQNFYWYENPTDRTVHLIPWDLDGAFGNFTDPSEYTDIADGWGAITANCEKFEYGPIDRLQRSAACDPLIGTLVGFDADYERLRAEFLAGPFSAKRVDEQLAAWTAQIERAVIDASATHADAVSLESWTAAVDELRRGVDISRTS